LKLLAFHKFQNTLENSPLTAAFIDELAPMFRFISEQEPEAANNLARYIMDFFDGQHGPIAGKLQFLGFCRVDTVQGAIFYILMRALFLRYWCIDYVHEGS
jgi:hypothetical protein